MAESQSHRRAKAHAAGRHGQTERPIQGGRRVDAVTAGGGRATEVERSGDRARLEEAALRLKDSGARQHVLQVPQHHMSAAAEAMRKAGVLGTVKNMKGTRRRSV